jgi:hypothetical protein
MYIIKGRGNQKQHRAIATDMVNEFVQEHVVQTEDGEMYEWLIKRGIRFRVPDLTKPIRSMMDGKEIRNAEVLGSDWNEYWSSCLKYVGQPDAPFLDINTNNVFERSQWSSKYLSSREGRAFFMENKVQFSGIEARKLFPNLRSNNGNRRFSNDHVAFSNSVFNMESLTFMTHVEFESSGLIAAVNHVDHEVPANILANPGILKSHTFFHSVKYAIPTYLTLFQNDTHAQLQLALLGVHQSPRGLHHKFEIASHVIGTASCGKSEEQDVDQEIMNKENCHVASYQQISSNNSFADSQLQQQSIGKKIMLIDELPDHGCISASSYKNWVSQKSSVNANVKNQQRLTKGTFSMGLIYSGNKTLEYGKDGVGPNNSWPDTGCLRRTFCRNKKLDPRPYKFMKNVTPSEKIAESEVLLSSF